MGMSSIQHLPQGKPVHSLEPHIDAVWSLTEHASSIASGFIGETSKMYKRALGEKNNASAEIDRFFNPEDDPSERYRRFSGEFLGVALASHVKHEPHYIGSACLRRYQGPEAKEH